MAGRDGPDWKALGDAFRDAMGRQRIQVDELARVTGVSERTIVGIRNGEQRDNLPRRAGALESEVGWPPGTMRAIAFEGASPPQSGGVLRRTPSRRRPPAPSAGDEPRTIEDARRYLAGVQGLSERDRDVLDRLLDLAESQADEPENTEGADRKAAGT